MFGIVRLTRFPLPCTPVRTTLTQRLVLHLVYDANYSAFCPCFGAADLLRDSCQAGYYCPSGATSPNACPSGTYNPHDGMDGEDDCQISPAGYYAIEASTNFTGSCSAGYYCPAGSTGPQQVRVHRERWASGVARGRGPAGAGGAGENVITQTIVQLQHILNVKRC